MIYNDGDDVGDDGGGDDDDGDDDVKCGCDDADDDNCNGGYDDGDDGMEDGGGDDNCADYTGGGRGDSDDVADAIGQLPVHAHLAHYAVCMNNLAILEMNLFQWQRQIGLD